MGPSWAETLIFVAVWGAAVTLGSFIGVTVPLYLLLKRRSSGDRARPGSAPEIARERYARGEISRAEYEQLRDDLDEDLRVRKERAR